MANPRADMDVTSEEEFDENEVYLTRHSLLMLLSAARNRRRTANADDFYQIYLEPHGVDFPVALAIWQAANRSVIARDAEEFCNIFAGGLINGRDYVISHEPANRQDLFLAARLGKYEKFVTQFNWGFVNVNATYKGQTFLHALLSKDSGRRSVTPGVQGRAQIAAFVLEKGASIDIPGEFGDEVNVTVRQLLHRWQNNNAPTWSNSFYFTFFEKPSQGDTVFPVIAAHARQQQQAGATYDDMEAVRPVKYARFGN